LYVVTTVVEEDEELQEKQKQSEEGELAFVGLVFAVGQDAAHGKAIITTKNKGNDQKSLRMKSSHSFLGSDFLVSLEGRSEKKCSMLLVLVSRGSS
jgi:hypothetical protein